jgi:hypothetical protein
VGAQLDNLNALLSKGLEYLEQKLGMLKLAISASRPKADICGFNHPMIVHLPCPVDYLSSFDEDPKEYATLPTILLLIFFPYRFRAKLLNGSIKIHSTDYPICHYDKELIDDDNLDSGFLQSRLLVVVSLHLHDAVSLLLIGCSF